MLFSKKEKSEGKPSGSPRLATSMALVISIIVHASIFLIVGSVVIFEGAIPPNLFDSLGGGMVEESGPMEMEAPPLLEEAPMPDPIDDPLDAAPADAPMTTSSATSDIIASTVTSPSFNVSSAVSTGLLGPSVKNPMVGRSTRGTGTSRGPGAPRAANIFGRSVEANRLGVILDVSHSTHELIDYAIEEIQSGFPKQFSFLPRVVK